MIFFRRLDALIVIALTAAAMGAYFLIDKETGSHAEVYINNRKAAAFNIEGPVQLKEVDSRIGKIKLKIGEGAIQVVESPCTHKICILQGAIKETNEHIICVPAQLHITVVNNNSKKTNEQIDAISY